jgi:2-succinyl-6-hydroxy-2,4-cyclohexadiene-1-carboxylate synthase
MLLHGFTGSGEHWAMTAAGLRNAYRVIVPDLIGHGRTESPAALEHYRIENASADLISLLDALAISSVGLLGYSMGGRLALYTAVHYPTRIKTLMLESASPGLRSAEERTARRRSDEALAASIEQDGIESFVDTWERLPLFASQAPLSPQQLERLRAGRLRNTVVGLANSLREMGTGVQPSLWEKLPLLKMPTLLIAGALDAKFTTIAQQMHALLPDAQLAILPDAGHTVHLEQPEAFSEAVIAFLKRTQ